MSIKPNFLNRTKFIVWFNNSKFMNFLLVPVKFVRFWRTAQRLRFCESCHKFTTDNHWSRYDYINTHTGLVKYDHVFLCDGCFYGPKI